MVLEGVAKVAEDAELMFTHKIHKKKVFMNIDNSLEFQIRRRTVFILIAHFTIADICT